MGVQWTTPPAGVWGQSPQLNGGPWRASAPQLKGGVKGGLMAPNIQENAVVQSACIRCVFSF